MVSQSSTTKRKHSTEPSRLDSEIEVRLTWAQQNPILGIWVIECQYSHSRLLFALCLSKLGPNSGWSSWLYVRDITFPIELIFLFLSVVCVVFLAIGTKLRILLPLAIGAGEPEVKLTKISLSRVLFGWAWRAAEFTQGKLNKNRRAFIKLHSGRKRLPVIAPRPKFDKSAGIWWHCWSWNRRKPISAISRRRPSYLWYFSWRRKRRGAILADIAVLFLLIGSIPFGV